MPKLKYFVPNSVTALSLLLGLASVVMSVEGRFDLAAWMILWCTLFDKLDGSLARLLKASSEFGIQFDSLADFVSFGIAPAALVFFQLQSAGVASPLLGPAAAVYVLALAIRLARFNVSEPPLGADVFFGIPGTLCGAILASGFLVWRRHSVNLAWLEAAPALLVVLAIMMVSQLRLPKLKPRKNRALNAFQALNIVAVYLCGVMMWAPEFLLTLALLFLIGGVIACWLSPPAVAEPSEVAADEAHDGGAFEDDAEVERPIVV
jgi:CDP-diacylglycerol--serine O-phosphatidyltransferase